MVSLTKYHPRTVPIEGHAIDVRIARLTFNQAEEHRRRLNALRQTTVRQRRELDATAGVSAEDLARLRDAHAKEDRDTEAMVRAAVEAYVSVVPNQIAVDGHEVTTGQDLMEYFGSDTDLVILLMRAIDEGAEVKATTGKTFGSPSDSTRSSDASNASGPGADGPRPEGTVASAVPAGTTAIGDVRAETDRPSSGSMEILS